MNMKKKHIKYALKTIKKKKRFVVYIDSQLISFRDQCKTQINFFSKTYIINILFNGQ